MKLIAFAVLLSAACAAPMRYVVAEDPGSRHHFRYVLDTTTRSWANRECELRVAAERPLPPDVSVQLFRPMTVESAYMRRIGDRVWRLMHVMSKDDLAGRVAYGVQVKWEREGQETRYESMELFRLAAPGEPDRWSEWTTASEMRDGAFAWWEEAHGTRGSPPAAPAHPFSMRCRVVLMDVPGRLP